jgi:cobalt/nickel transport system ATP-binding protein
MPSVEEELAFGPLNLGWKPKEVEESVRRVAKRLNIEHLLKKSTLELSFGQRRLVSVACVLTMNPVALILDEPTNGLDEENWKRVAEFLSETDRTILLITHDLRLAEELGWRVFDLGSLRKKKSKED